MILIKNGRLINPATDTDEILDIAISDGIIKKIAYNIIPDESDDVIDAKGKVVAPGLIDVHVHFRDPGFTYKEDIITGSNAAAKGGYTTVICMANTNPAVDNEETFEYVKKEAQKSKIHVLQAAAITVGLEGKKLVDMEKLKSLGAVGFTDDGVALIDNNIVIEAMRMAKKLNVPLSMHEEEPSLVVNPGINAGKVSERMGLQGASHLAEEIMIARDCIFALDIGAKINIQHISSGESVEIIRYAKSRGADVIAEVSPHHFSLVEEDVLKYGSYCKMNPPLRTQSDRIKLIDGLKDGTIDIIATDHAPHSKDEKEKEFTKCTSGIIGLETALSLGITNLVKNGHISLNELIKKMTVNPAKLYNLDSGSIESGKMADLVIFDPEEKWLVKDFSSKSSNSPFINQELFGKVKYTICCGKIVYKD